MARSAGAKKVYFSSAAPEVRYRNVYGIDMPSVQDLIAHNRTVDEICELIGADWLVFQDLDDLVASTDGGKVRIERFDCSVFDGQYVTGDIDENYLNQMETLQAELEFEDKPQANAIIELYNSEN